MHWGELMLLSINLYAHPGQASQGPAAREDVQQNLEEYPLRSSPLQLVAGIELQPCALHRRLPDRVPLPRPLL